MDYYGGWVDFSIGFFEQIVSRLNFYQYLYDINLMASQVFGYSFSFTWVHLPKANYDLKIILSYYYCYLLPSSLLFFIQVNKTENKEDNQIRDSSSKTTELNLNTFFFQSMLLIRPMVQSIHPSFLYTLVMVHLNKYISLYKKNNA